jgi:hypothetical protein
VVALQQEDIDRLRAEFLGETGAPRLEGTEVLHSWQLSHVERWTTSEGTLVFKCAADPFTLEHEALADVRQARVPVPRLFAAKRGATTLGMLMEDLGRPKRQATDEDGVEAAVLLHAAAVPDRLASGSTEWLASLPERALRSLRLLQEERWQQAGDIADTLQSLGKAAHARASGAMTRPYGWVHSEFHPESVLVTETDRYLFDFARAFHGPGLIDLASWLGTVDSPSPDRARKLLEAYVHRGGPAEALNDRGGLPAPDWALGWHRVWVLAWFLDQALVWIRDPEADPAYMRTVRRHAHEAATLLRV